ncbi:MAG TPA: DUF1801 domain-containing protein [Cyclobacteriaceae bacterium]|nr:DUF1801 domain-containing protein [Cyclobacteriaceae bacterium]
MAKENKTTETAASVSGFIDKIKDETKRDDSYRIIKLMQKHTGFKPKMWGPSIIGFGTYHYQYESGREGDMPIIAFSPRSTAIVLYFSSEFKNRTALLKKFGKHKASKGCVYVKKLADVDMEVLEEMIVENIKKVAG